MNNSKKKQIENLSPLTLLPSEDIEKGFQKVVDILEYVSILEEVTDIPQEQEKPVECSLREDKVTPSLSQEDALSQAGSTRDGYFVVDRVL